ncbi:MAG: LysR family transcriptional regulator [Mogibacterium sp.]|nr:LysR family transcriptional regulator [Mogibacterium sp.]
MEIRNIATFVRVAELLSFSKAANRLGYSQAAVTVQIKNLEEELNVQLFDRMGKSIKLTSAGEKFLPYASEFLRSIDVLSSSLKENDDIDGRLRITTSSSVSSGILPRLILGFHHEYPQVEIQLRTTDIFENMLEKLYQNETDFIFCLQKPSHLQDCIRVAAHREEVVFVTSPENPLASRENVSLEAILSEPFIASDRDASYCLYLMEYLEEREIPFEPVMEISSTAAITQLLQTGFGVSFLPRFLIEDLLDKGKLAVIDTPSTGISVWVQLIRHKNKWVNPQMQAFMDYVCSEFGADES